MNRRNFFKVVTGFVAGVVGISAKSNKRPGTKFIIKCYGKDGTLCPRCKFNCKVEPPCPITEHLNRMERLRIEAAEKMAHPPYIVYPDGTMVTSSNNYWDKDEPDIYTFSDGVPV